MIYTGIFIRDYVGQVPNQQQRPLTKNSPDIFCSGTTPLADVTALTNQNNYDRGLPMLNLQTPMQNNYIYVRGQNLSGDPQQAVIYLYYAEPSIVQWPQNWKSDQISFGTSPQNWQPISAPGATTVGESLTVTPQPFTWMPDSKNTHYSLVTWIENGPDQQHAPKIPVINTVQEMTDFIQSHPNVAWKNVIELDSNQSVLQGSVSVDGPTNGGVINLGLQFNNMPTDAYFEFNVPGPDANNTIIFPKTQIYSPNFAPSLQVAYPPGFKTALSFTIYVGATTPAANATVTPFMGEMENAMAVAQENAAANTSLQEANHYGTPAELDMTMKTATGAAAPAKMYIVGSVPFVFQQQG
jgi:hypothetical protein